MTTLDIRPDIEQGDSLNWGTGMVAQGQLTTIGLLRHGTVGGRATVSMVITLQDGSTVFAETTWALFRLAARALAASPVAAEEPLDP